MKLRLFAAAAASIVWFRALPAQTAYYNTDRGRPVQIEDAYATERFAFELKFAPVRLERARGGVYKWGIEPEIAFGVLPRTHIELGVPIAIVDLGGAATRTGVAGLEASILHNLNVETRSLPALGIRADILAPVGGLALDKAYSSITALATRTFRWARFHLNGQYTFGETPLTADPGAVEISRWLAGFAFDKSYPLRAMLVTVETYARGPIEDGGQVEYTGGAGIRYQLSPTLAIDGGMGRQLNGPSPAWFATFGAAYSFGLAGLMPGRDP